MVQRALGGDREQAAGSRRQLQGQRAGVTRQNALPAGNAVVVAVCRHAVDQANDLQVLRRGAAAVEIPVLLDLGPVAVAQAPRQAIAKLQHLVRTLVAGNQHVDHMLGNAWRGFRASPGGVRACRRVFAKQVQPLPHLVLRLLQFTLAGCTLLGLLVRLHFGDGWHPGRGSGLGAHATGLVRGLQHQRHAVFAIAFHRASAVSAEKADVALGRSFNQHRNLVQLSPAAQHVALDAPLARAGVIQGAVQHPLVAIDRKTALEGGGRNLGGERLRVQVKPVVAHGVFNMRRGWRFSALFPSGIGLVLLMGICSGR